MSAYSSNDLPVSINHEEYVELPGGVCVRFETNGEAKDLFLRGEFEPVMQLFPDCEYVFDTEGVTYRVRAGFDDRLVVERA